MPRLLCARQPHWPWMLSHSPGKLTLSRNTQKRCYLSSFSKTKRQCSQAGCLHHPHTHTLCRDSTVPTCSTSDETRSWPATNKKPVIFSEIGHRKWTFAGRTVIIPTCSKCAFPHEQQEENGIKLDQGRFILVKKKKQDKGLKHWLQQSSHLLAHCLEPSAKFPFFFDPLFILPQWDRFPRIHQSLRYLFLSLVLFLSLSLLSLLIQSRLKMRGWTSKDCVKLKKRISRSHLSSYVHLLNGNFSTSDLSFHGEICCDPGGVKS